MNRSRPAIPVTVRKKSARALRIETGEFDGAAHDLPRGHEWKVLDPASRVSERSPPHVSWMTLTWKAQTSQVNAWVVFRDAGRVEAFIEDLRREKEGESPGTPIAVVDETDRSRFRSLAKAALYFEEEWVNARLVSGVDPEELDHRCYRARPISAAAYVGSIAAVRMLLDAGAGPSADEWKDGPLHEACSTGQAAVAGLLLDRGAPIDAHGEVGLTPLHKAVASGDLGTVRLLLDRGARLDIGASYALDSVTPFHSAVLKGRTEIVRLMLARGADVNADDRGGETPLHWAARDGDDALFQLLLDAGADPKARTRKGRAPADFAEEAGHRELAARLRKMNRARRR